jgi:diaminopimelate epimerase
LRFVKAQGAGNHFILIDDRRGFFPLSRALLIARMCDPCFGIGADGLILLQSSQHSDYRMRFFNADGSEAALCGNGLRCFALFAAYLGDHRLSMSVETDAGKMHLSLDGDCVSTRFPEPVIIHDSMQLSLGNHCREIALVDSGVPHAIFMSSDIDQEDVTNLGRAVRMHPLFGPEGVNVSWIRWKELPDIQIRTYERGVEAETQACATAALSAAKVIMHRSQQSTARSIHDKDAANLFTYSSFTFYPLSRDPLRVDLTRWEVSGSAHIVFAGEMLENW